MPKIKHIHKYERRVLGKDYEVLRCTLPGCPHYIRFELGENLLSLCNRCLEPFRLTKANLTRKRPHCDDCTKVSGFAHRYKKPVEKIDTDRLKELLSTDDLMKKIGNK